MNLEERLNKHLQSIKEANGEITPKELLQLVKQDRKEVEKLANIVKELYPWFHLKDDILDHGSVSEFHNYVGSSDHNIFLYQAYCICSYLGVDSGINIDKAMNMSIDCAKKGIKNYNDHVEMGYTYKDYKSNPDKFFDLIDATDQALEEGREALQKYHCKPEEIVFSGDDIGDELDINLTAAKDSIEFASLCRAKDLANKLKNNPLVKKASILSNYIVIV